MNKIIDGKQYAQELNTNLKNSIEQLEGKRKPKLVIVQVGDNLASNKYIKNKLNACSKVGIIGELKKFDQDINKEELKKEISALTNDSNIDGIIVQLPLPNSINEKEIIDLIPANKDADGFNPQTIGNVMLNNSNIYPATPFGIVKLLDWKEINLVGANVVIVGRSNIVGKPLANMLINRSATVTVCNTKTRNLKDICKNADILISAAGSANLITKEFVNKEMTIIDVGANFVEGKYCGDVDFENVKDEVKYITPVPGGVGPMTIACLLQNTFTLYKEKENI
ncbi:bifunctional 5,10-methylenetetrahydrofolate dehydrogenase/5,10-methenyltetrahydrofolate cyclohydrolase [Spiroplasma sp. BIUS-1]|uniref:bifunctional 5,10-methylenetetrahydrofolate dehydrogenase/5,10-methenyltetrahydrofolate cyclohydrolase n=1 Tax=Spiroplasma sp. BIUS-1 TaxID=216964 RepID=UPI001399207D|nr:tetrahydrofolate dehydrogenase/cyclohydrolase catalytic domain-containing protein [Spiroplasma sp. BIUS-1]QHX36391.1 methylenetetrahydrofolate dehydrogenase/methylenetetrahydrofolate cyclohydrolase [Spiroplasma sp. BIUS-1]